METYFKILSRFILEGVIDFSKVGFILLLIASPIYVGHRFFGYAGGIVGLVISFGITFFSVINFLNYAEEEKDDFY